MNYQQFFELIFTIIIPFLMGIWWGLYADNFYYQLKRIINKYLALYITYFVIPLTLIIPILFFKHIIQAFLIN